MSRFGPDPLAFFNAIYQDAAPWDIGVAQPALSALFDEYPPEGPALDVGCGSGDLAIALAQRSLPVLGIDFVESAIAQARERAAALAPEMAQQVEFQVADALHPSRLQKQFATITDCAFYHLFNPEQSEGYVDELAASLLPGGRYYLLAFAIDFQIPNTPRLVTEEELRTRFTSERGWHIHTIRPAEILSRIAPVPAIIACIERVAASE